MTVHAGPIGAGPVTAPRPVTPSTILAASLQDIRRRLEDVEGLDQALAADVATLLADVSVACDLATGLDPYLGRCTTPESPALRRLAERTQAHAWDGLLEQEMLSGHVEGQTLKFLVHATRARRVLEIGMFTGYSALAMAEALPGDGEVVACEVDADVAAFAQESFDASPDGHKISVRVGPAQATLSDLAADGAAFDLVFIDADKAGYLGYLTTLLDTGLLAPHGVVAVDNTLMQGHPWLSTEPTANGRAIARFNEAVAAEPRVEQVLLPLRDGLTLICRARGSA